MKNNLEDLVREYGNVPAVGPGRCRKDVMAEITALAAPDGIVNISVAQEKLEQWFEGLGIDLGAEDLAQLFKSMCGDTPAAGAPAPALPDVPYSGLEERFFKGLNTITRRAVLQVLGGHSDAFMEQVRNHSDERRLFKHLFKADMPDSRPLFDRKLHDLQQRGYEVIGRILHKDGQYALFDSSCRWLEKAQYQRLMHEQDGSLFAAPAKPAEIKHSASCLSAGGGPSDDDCICGAHQAQLDALHPPTYAKFGYILQAADGHQTWLKGDPADGMGRYGKVIQLYRKEGA